MFELRCFFGPGYRAYCGEDADNIILLLCGGCKDTQARDIEKAKEYWQEYQDHA
jgi:putative addiction module killer protein